MFFEEKPQFGKREQIVRSPDKVFGIFGAFGLIEPCQVLDAVLVKASEKVCDPGLPAGRAGASAWPTNDADARAASAFATRPTCRAIESPGAPIRALAPAGIVRMMAAQFNPFLTSPNPRARWRIALVFILSQGTPKQYTAMIGHQVKT